MWFSGVHCDVGGGYAADQSTGAALSNIPLLWMASYAKAAGLQFTAGTLSNALLALDATASLHESRTGEYRLLPAHVRNITSDSCLASSVGVRCGNSGSNYAPSNLQFVAGQLATTYSLVDVSGIVI
jgi:Uncharacterized alpha/beta hydrolase domain (DUF2235)